MPDKMNEKRILILGGYGRAGKAIAAVLSERVDGCISIAGRHLDKAEVCVNELKKNPSIKASLTATTIDIGNFAELTAAFNQQDLVIVCTPLGKRTAKNIIEAVLKSSADYIDIVPSQEKYSVLEQYETEIERQNKCFLLDSAVDPGLPGWLARFAALQLDGVRELRLFARYRDNDIGLAGIRDLLDVASTKPKVFNGRWKAASGFHVKWVRYPGGLGSGLSVPVFLPELERLPEALGITKLSMLHAGINNLSDWIVMAWKLGLSRICSKARVGAWLQSAINKHTPDPTGVAMVAEAKTASATARVELWHYDLYLATAIPTALTAIKLLFGPRGAPGCWFLGDWVEPISFKNALERMGFHFEITASPSIGGE